MAINKQFFGTLPDGRQVSKWILTNDQGLQAEVLDYGVTIRSIIVPDRNGHPVDVVLGYDTLEEYIADSKYLGATVGRFANRICGAEFQLNGKTYSLFANDGKNHLHGGQKGFNKHLWESRQEGETVIFSRISPDGEEGYPGDLTVQVTIGWEGNSLRLQYQAETDQDTILNLTNHSYFNLNGAGNGTVDQHTVQIKSDFYMPSLEGGLPTGEVTTVDGTAMDFRKPKTIGQDADSEETCVKMFGGYNSNYILAGNPVAKIVGDQTGIGLSVDTDQPGMQFYTSNELERMTGKDGKIYDVRSAFCLETQHYPDCIHYPQWPSCILRPGETFHSFTSYTFL